MSDQNNSESVPNKEEKKETPIKSLELKATEQQVVKFNDFNNATEQLRYAEFLVKGGYVPFSKPEAVVMVINAGKELGLGPVASLMNMFSVGGKISMSNHLMHAIVRHRGVETELIKDYEAEYDDENNYRDMITTIRFFRYSELRKTVVHQDVSYRWSDAAMAGYTSKDNWTRMPRNMMRARCLAEGVRIVAPDLITGMFYSADEMLTDKNKTFEIDGDGNVIIEQGD